MDTNPRRKMTTLNLTWSTKERIDRYGRHKESYDDILNRILDLAEGRSPTQSAKKQESRREILNVIH